MSKQARLRTQELRAAQQAEVAQKARRRRILIGAGSVLIVGLLAAITLAVVHAAQRDRSLPGVSGKVVAPQHISSAGAIPVGKADAPVTVDLYFDYMCSFCGQFEKANASELTRLVADGKARIELHPLAFLDQLSSGTEYSTRSASAVAAVAEAAPDKVWDFHRALYAQQPAEGSKGLSDDQIAAIATAAGVPAAVIATFGDATYRPWIASTTQQSFDAGIEHTPTIKINGEVFSGDAYHLGPLTEAIDSAAMGQ